MRTAGRRTAERVGAAARATGRAAARAWRRFASYATSSGFPDEALWRRLFFNLVLMPCVWVAGFIGLILYAIGWLVVVAGMILFLIYMSPLILMLFVFLVFLSMETDRN